MAAYKYPDEYGFMNDPKFQKTDVYKAIAPTVKSLLNPSTRQSTLNKIWGKLTPMSDKALTTHFNQGHFGDDKQALDWMLFPEKYDLDSDYRNEIYRFLANPDLAKGIYSNVMGQQALQDYNATGSTVPRGTVGAGNVAYGNTSFSNQNQYSTNLAKTPGAGLYSVFGTPKEGTNLNGLIDTWIGGPQSRHFSGFLEGPGTFGRNDAKFPTYQSLLKQGYSKPEAFDMVMRANHYNAQLKPQGFDIGDVLVPVGQMVLGAMGQPWLAAAVGAGRDISKNGLTLNTPFAIAGGYGMGQLGGDLYNLGPTQLIENKVSGITDAVLDPVGTAKGLFTSTGPKPPATLSGIAGSTANTLNNVPGFLQPNNQNQGSTGLQALGIGQTTQNLTLSGQNPNGTAPITSRSRTITAAAPRTNTGILGFNMPNYTPPRSVANTPVRSAPTLAPPAATPMFGQLGGTKTVRRAMGGPIDPQKSAMNPMGGAPASQFGLAGLMQGGVAKDKPVEGYLDGPGDGMSDSIKATIDGHQPARLADGEFVIPADVVSHLGNGSSKAGAKMLYAMMDRIRHARTGNKKQGKQIDAKKYLPA
jgi:hypothetical protein